MSMSALRNPLRSDVELNVIKALSNDYVPLGVKAIIKALPVGGRPTTKQIAAILDELVAVEKVTRFTGRTPKFSIGPARAWVRGRILARLNMGPLRESALKKLLTPGYAPEFKTAVDTLVREGMVYVHPALASRGQVQYSLEPADPLRYIARDLNKLLAGAQRLGFSATQLRDAVERGVDEWTPPTPSSLRQLIIGAMRQLDFRVDQGAAVSIPQLRVEIGSRYDKRSFDEAMLELARQRIVEMQSHAWSNRLTPAERDSMIENGQGGWYDSVGLLKGAKQ